MTLFNRLKSFESKRKDNKLKEFTKKISHINDFCTKLTPSFITMNPHFTCHDFRHSLAIIKILDNLCEELLFLQNPFSFNYSEIFCLLASSYLHDTGMIYNEENDEAKIEEINRSDNMNHFTTNDLRRMEHHIRSYKYILNHLDDLQLDMHIARVIGTISRGHRLVDINSEDFKNEIIDNEIIRVRVLSALLRLADELDLSYKRITPELMDIFNAEKKFEFSSKLHFMKHLYTAGIIIGNENIGKSKIKTINISLNVPNDDYERRMSAIIRGPIVREVNYTKPILKEVGIEIKMKEILCNHDENVFIVPDIIFYRFYKPYRNKMRILIVDDKLEYRKIFSEILADDGYHVDAVINGDEALEKIEDDQYDLVLLDIIMRTDDEGIHILKKIRKYDNNITVFMISVMDDVETAINSIKIGAKNYFIKEKLNVMDFRLHINNVFEDKFDIISIR